MEGTGNCEPSVGSILGKDYEIVQKMNRDELIEVPTAYLQSIKVIIERLPLTHDDRICLTGYFNWLTKNRPAKCWLVDYTVLCAESRLELMYINETNYYFTELNNNA